MHGPNHCIGGVIRATYRILLSWIMQAERSPNQADQSDPEKNRHHCGNEQEASPGQFFFFAHVYSGSNIYSVFHQKKISEVE